VKTESEIRKHRDNLLAMAAVPCTCADVLGKLVCESIRNKCQAEADLLSWCLGENPALQELVDGFELAHQVVACPNN
jgi:hypothetical protein